MDKESKLEEEILASFERDEWRSVPNLKEEIALCIDYLRFACHGQARQYTYLIP